FLGLNRTFLEQLTYPNYAELILYLNEKDLGATLAEINNLDVYKLLAAMKIPDPRKDFDSNVLNNELKRLMHALSDQDKTKLSKEFVKNFHQMKFGFKEYIWPEILS